MGGSFVWAEHNDQFIRADWKILKDLFHLARDFGQVISPPVQVK